MATITEINTRIAAQQAELEELKRKMAEADASLASLEQQRVALLSRPQKAVRAPPKEPQWALLPAGTQLRIEYKGTLYAATFKEPNDIRTETTTFKSLNLWGTSITGYSLNVWLHAEFKQADGTWKKVDTIRKPRCASSPAPAQPAPVVDLRFYSWTHEGVDYFKNDRGDVISTDIEWVGRFDGQQINVDVEAPTDLGDVEIRM